MIALAGWYFALSLFFVAGGFSVWLWNAAGEPESVEEWAICVSAYGFIWSVFLALASILLYLFGAAPFGE